MAAFSMMKGRKGRELFLPRSTNDCSEYAADIQHLSSIQSTHPIKAAIPSMDTLRFAVKCILYIKIPSEAPAVLLYII
jgi:hypothetical protein